VDDRNRLELMKRMLDRLRGQPGPSPTRGDEQALVSEQKSSSQDHDPAEARLRVLRNLIERLGG